MNFKSLILGLAMLAFVSCKKDEVTDVVDDNTKGTVVVTANITSNTTWKANNIYVFKKYIYVDSMATLTIEPGTIIRCENDDANSTKAALIIKRGAKLMAEGTSAKPIIFTSNKAKGLRAAGDWGGIWICGNAPSNAGATVAAEADLGVYYGGNNPTDNSGSLKYLRIEFGGVALQPNKEINGLTFAGVGSGTTVENIQVSFSGDDSYEWFGGTVNCKNLIAYKGVDDDFDTDNGYSGNVQFGLAVRDASIADISGSNGFESDNDANGTSASPFTSANFSNITIIGPVQNDQTTIATNFKRGAHLRRSTKLGIYNSVILGFPIGLYMDGTNTAVNCNNDELQIRNTVVSSWKGVDSLTTDSTFNANLLTNVSSWYLATNYANQATKDLSTLKMNNPFATTPDASLKSDSPLLTGASFSGSRISNTFFQSVSYRGAFGTSNWATGWVNFDPKNTDY